MPLIRDLVCDMKPFWDKHLAVKPWLENKEPIPPPDQEYRVPNAAMEELIQEVSCISCGACLMDCESFAVNSNFLGPQLANRRFARGLPIGRRAVGNPTRVTAIFDAPRGDWNPGGAPPDPLLDLGSHLVDLCCWITGARPDRARSMAAAPGRARFELEMTGGVRLHAVCGEAPAYRELLDPQRGGETRSWRWPGQPFDRCLSALLAGRLH